MQLQAANGGGGAAAAVAAAGGDGDGGAQVRPRPPGDVDIMQWRYSIVFVVMMLVYGISYHFYGILCLAFLATGLGSVSTRLREAVQEKNGRNTFVSLASCVLHFCAVAFFLDWDRVVLNALSLGQLRALVIAMASGAASGEWELSRETVLFPAEAVSPSRISLGLPSVTEQALLAGRVGEQFAATAIVALVVDMLAQFCVLGVKGMLAIMPAVWMVQLGRAISCQREVAGAAQQGIQGTGGGAARTGQEEGGEEDPLVGGDGGGAGAIRVRGGSDPEAGQGGGGTGEGAGDGGRGGEEAGAEGQGDQASLAVASEAHRRLRSLLAVVEHTAVPWRLLVVLPLWVVYLSQPAFGITARASSSSQGIPSHASGQSTGQVGHETAGGGEDTDPGTSAGGTSASVAGHGTKGVLMALLSHPFVVIYLSLKLFAVGYSCYKLYQTVRTCVMLTGSSFYRVLSAAEYQERGRPDCPILQDEAEVPALLQCGHICDRDAITQWAERRAECPICRAKLRDPLEDEPCAQGGLTLPFMWL